MLEPEPRSFLSRNRWWLVGSALLAFAALWYVRDQRPQPVDVVAVRAGPTERVLAITGRTRPQVTITIVPKVAGQIVALTKQEGDSVTAGEVLVKLDAPALRASVDQAESTLQAQRRALSESERTFTRQAELRERGLTTLKDYDQAKFDRDQAQAAIKRLSAARREAAARLADSTLTAPVSGVVLSRPVDLGQVVSAQSVIYEIAPLTDVEIETEVDERYLPEVLPGLTADVLITGRQDPLAATVYYVASKVDPRSGGAKVRLKLDAPPADLRAGVTADVNIIIERLDAALTVPRSALLGRDARARALLLRDGKVVEQPVSFREWPSDRVIVTSGLAPGDQLLAQPSTALIGERVTPTNEPEPDLAARDRSGGLRSL